MKKIAVIISGLFLFATLSFGQTPQTKEKNKSDAKTETQKKDGKECSKKDMKECSKKDGTKSCCSHGSDAAKKDEKAPDKK
jgi:hypothetical protein